MKDKKEEIGIAWKRDRHSPCAECPYKLGKIKTLVNPCPQCQKNGYRFLKESQKTW